MSPAQLPPKIVPVPSAQREEALRLIFRRLNEAELSQYVVMTVASESTAKEPWAGLLGAYRGALLVGTVYWQIQAGRTASLWPPQLLAEEPRATAIGLLDAAVQRLATQDVQLVQSLLRANGDSDGELLREGGFNRLSDLLYLVSLAGGFPVEPPAGSLDFEPYTHDSHDRFVRIVEATYVETLDCPGLNGLRDVEDVLAGYRAAGTFDNKLWLLARHAGEDVGCLILSDHPEYDTLELVYMGVAAQGRGHGWGREIARHAQSVCRQACRSRVVVAVDASNTPAVRMYAAVGFETWDRRSVYLKSCGG